METDYNGIERRKFVRLDHITLLDYRICKKEIILKLLQGYTSNISQAGLLCNMKEKVNINDVLWLSFNRSVLEICEAIERKSLIYQNGVIGKVVRVEYKENNTYNVGVRFITREEKDATHICSEVDSVFEEKEKEKCTD